MDVVHHCYYFWVSIDLQCKPGIRLQNKEQGQRNQSGPTCTPAGSSAPGTTPTRPEHQVHRTKKNKNTNTKYNHTMVVCTTKPGPKQKKNVRRLLGKLRIPVEVISPRYMAIPRRVAPRRRLQLCVCRLNGQATEDRLSRPLHLGNRTISFAVVAVDTRSDNVVPVAPTAFAARHHVIKRKVVDGKPLATILSAQTEITRSSVVETQTRDSAGTSVAA